MPDAGPKAEAEFSARVRDLVADLRDRFDTFCRIDTPEQIEAARGLMAQVGTVDAEIEGYASTENQRDLSIKFHWGHNHRFTDDLALDGRMGIRHINLMAQFIEGFGLGLDSFEGRRCIDVGCWTGGTTMMLKMMGASEVLAIEEVRKYANTARTLATEVYGLDGVRCDAVSLYDFEPEERYDIAYFPGVVYHLSDPVLGLRRLFNALDDGGICLVETAGVNAPQCFARFEGSRTYHSTEGESAKDLNRGGWNWFVPTPSCLEAWMVEAGFADVRSFFSPVSKRAYAIGTRRTYVDICRAGLSVPDIR